MNFRTSLNKLGEVASARNECAICHAIGHVQSGLGVQVLAAAIGSFALLLHFIASFQLESMLDSESILEAHMSSGAIHRRFACMGCTARSNGRGEPSFFNDYKSAAVHFSCSSFCNKSMRGFKAVTVQLNTQGRRRWSTWRMAPPTRAIPLSQVP
jgi:hypothetical protein